MQYPRLKRLIAASLLNVFDFRRLSEMSLPKENFLQLITPEADEAGSASTRDASQQCCRFFNYIPEFITN